MNELGHVLESVLGGVHAPDGSSLLAIGADPATGQALLRVDSVELALPLAIAFGDTVAAMLPSAAMTTGFDPVFHRLRLRAVVGELEE